MSSTHQHARPVVLVPGYNDDSTVFHHLTHYLQRERFDVHALTLFPSDGTVPLDELALQVSAYVERTFAAGTSVDFLGFSMGGIVLRYYLQRLGGLSRAEHFVTLGSPHRGTWMAYYVDVPGVRQMRPRSPFLVDLAQDEETLAKIKFTSIWTPLDLTIVPSNSSVLPVGRHLPLNLLYHRALISDERALRLVAQTLCDCPIDAMNTEVATPDD
ncbi:lipase [bacterium]|nr:lipase [bacterium]